MTPLQIATFESDHDLPLYEESQGQEGPAYLYLDTRDGGVSLEAKHPAYANTWGQDEQNGHVRRWNVPNNLTVDGINQLLTDQDVLTRLEAIMGGTEEYYDGSNYRTKLSEQAEETSEELERYLSDSNYPSLEAWSAHQWLNAVSYADCVQNGETHEQAATRLKGEALKSGIYLSEYDVEKTLDAMKKNAEEDSQ